MFKRVDQVLPERLNRLKVRRPVEASAVCAAVDRELGKLWQHAVPMRAVSFRAGRVVIAVTSPAWAHEVSSRFDRIRDGANRRLKKAAVKELRTRVSPADAAIGPEDRPV